MIYDKQYYESKNNIILKPKTIMFKFEKYNIIKCHPNYYIKKYYIIVNNKKDNIIQDIIICNSCHPNAWGGENENLNLDKPPEFSKFCLPNDIIGAKLISDSSMQKYADNINSRPTYKIYSDNPIRYMLMYWSLDDPHHFPLRKHIKTTPPLPKEILNERYI